MQKARSFSLIQFVFDFEDISTAIEMTEEPVNMDLPTPTHTEQT